MKKDDRQTDPEFSSSPAASEENLDALARTLVKDLGLGEDTITQETRDFSVAFAGFLALPPATLSRVGMDLSVACGLSGDWNLALQFVTRVLESNDERSEAKLWRLRCLVECARFAEALALGQAVVWKNRNLIHVNYLTGLAFEALGMREQSQNRFDAVRRLDPNYRDVQFRI